MASLGHTGESRELNAPGTELCLGSLWFMLSHVQQCFAWIVYTSQDWHCLLVQMRSNQYAMIQKLLLQLVREPCSCKWHVLHLEIVTFLSTGVLKMLISLSASTRCPPHFSNVHHSVYLGLRNTPENSLVRITLTSTVAISALIPKHHHCHCWPGDWETKAQELHDGPLQ